MRAMKAEGGWGVVCTENMLVDAWSDISPFAAVRLWSDEDVPGQELMVEQVHEHGALAGCELAHFGVAASNRVSRATPMGPTSRLTMEAIDPVQSKAMDKTDIRNFRRRHREAALRAKRAGFDVVYIYCLHENSILSQFFSPLINDRIDEYGGNFENRSRLFREILLETKDAVGDKCAVAVRLGTIQLSDDRHVDETEIQNLVEHHAEMPDLWDVCVNNWSYDSATSRFAAEAHEEPYVTFVKKLTSKPVVGVGRFTTPDTMLSQVDRGILDFIGAARPSIADPFLPKKIEEGRHDDIRECIGCNICVSGENSFTTMRCTQNPTIMEEWRRGWHPENVPAKASDDSVLIIGAGPAGLETALVLGKRGYCVTLAEATDVLGGRVVKESSLPGLTEWIRVRDYRVHQLQQMKNVELYLHSPLEKAQVLEFAFNRVICAMGATWRDDGVGRTHMTPIAKETRARVFTPDDVMNNVVTKEPVVVYDDDGAYLAPALAEKLKRDGLRTTIVTPHLTLARWTTLTLEQQRLLGRLLDLGIAVDVAKTLTSIGDGQIELDCVYSRVKKRVEAGSVVLVTSRTPNDNLFHTLAADREGLRSAGVTSVQRVGDCEAPGLIATAVFSGHKLARELDGPDVGDVCYRRELPALD
jgi:dimethylamine/trimethylamine dehydrogenase